MFILVLTLFAITIITEITSLYLQSKFSFFTIIAKKHDFQLHAFISLTLWSISGIAYITYLIKYLNSEMICYLCPLVLIGEVLMVFGIILSSIGFYQLGLKRSLHLNFFRKETPIEKKGIYGYVKNPEYYGFWLILFSIFIITGSKEFLFLFLEIIILMIPLMKLENTVLRE